MMSNPISTYSRAVACGGKRGEARRGRESRRRISRKGVVTSALRGLFESWGVKRRKKKGEEIQGREREREREREKERKSKAGQSRIE
jgi:hypothetical protein